jgi:hypothetical protein
MLTVPVKWNYVNEIIIFIVSIICEYFLSEMLQLLCWNYSKEHNTTSGTMNERYSIKNKILN